MRDKIPSPKEDYRLEELDGELLLYHPATTATIYLNDTASLVWNLCNGERSVGEIMDVLKDSFPEAADSIPEDVEMTLSEFVEHGAIELG
jgi:hypothetical protein